MNGSRSSFGADAVVAAVVLSAAIHAAIMIWARPHVMTRVVSESVRVSRRPPSSVSRADARPEPVKFEILDDLPAQREAPEADDSGTAAPAPDNASPVSPDSRPMPAAIAAPDVLERMVPDAEAPVLPPASSQAAASPEVTASMPFESFLPAASDAFPGGASVAGPLAGLVAAPAAVPSAPAPQPPPPAPEETAAVSAAPAEAPGFVPVDEVMPEVDEKIVAVEKAAVRDLIGGARAADLAKSVDVSLSKFTGGDGFTYFKAVVAPKADLPTVPKDVVVLIDASGSIGNDRLTSCRKAARGILRTCTNSGDRFNLVAFRDRFSYAFRTWRACDSESFAEGDRWLSRLAAHGRTDVFSTISSVLTLPRDPARPIVALVVTDGEANEGVKGNDEIISRFTALNDGLVSVYMYGVKSAANRELIDLLTRGNRGESFVFGGWRWNAGAGIEALSERFRDPVVTDLRLVFASSCPAEAYPSLLRNLCRGNQVEIVGRLPGSPAEVAFSLKGLAGSGACDGYFRLPLAQAAQDETLPDLWMRERAIDRRLR